MFSAVVLFIVPVLVASSGDGNIKLLEEEVAIALKSCIVPKEVSRQRRSNEFSYDEYSKNARIDSNTKQNTNQYNHERRNASDMRDQMHVLNATDYDYVGYGAGNAGEKYIKTVPRPAIGNNTNNNNDSVCNETVNRTRRSEPLLTKDDSDQCLSQCVFANLEVVDTRGIPREAELWNKIQTSVASQQSRIALHDQVRACFQDMQTETEDNGCSYSNKLERCLMLRFADRKTNYTQGIQKT